MMPVEIDPSEVRRPPTDPRESLRARLGRPAMLAGLAAIGIGGCAGLAAAAYPTISDLLRPRPAQVHFGRVADMPEIKDGIPALRTNPVRQVPITQASINQAPVSQAATSPDSTGQVPTGQAPMASAVPPTTPPVAPAALLDPKPVGASGALTQTSPVPGAPAQGFRSQGSWSPSSDGAATGTAAAFQPVPTAVPKAPETPRPVAAPREAATPREATMAHEPAPLPPARAVQAKVEPKPDTKPAASPRETKAEPKATPRPAPAREAKAEPAKPAPARQAAEAAVAEKRPTDKRQTEKHAAEKPVARRDKPEAHPRSAAAQPAAAPAPEEPTRFLGVPMPDLAPAGRAIKETVDAVISFPSRL
ncbi:hypothetical protein LRS73_15515 [Methylobacterium currus]|uniref:hypothetical protein n=1 Tax=Methylobacterium currus TaxID=2051553 RepID=UPI001E400913|nr:hypothetical protein [Methylobacterium currus]UHC13991.1 hypothetical protein LRS73_15515 [Methylobacterium currus]